MMYSAHSLHHSVWPSRRDVSSTRLGPTTALRVSPTMHEALQLTKTVGWCPTGSLDCSGRVWLITSRAVHASEELLVEYGAMYWSIAGVVSTG